MIHDEARHLLDQLVVLRHRCDLDLLVFFARHPHSLLTSEQITTWLGYEPRQIAESLDRLLEAKLLSRTQNPTHAARLYVLGRAADAPSPWRPSLLALASTRDGRLALLDALARTAPGTPAESAAGRAGPAAGHRPRAFVLHRTKAADATEKAG